MKIRTRRVDPVIEARLVAAGIAPLLARLYAGRGIESSSQIDAGLERLLEPASLTYAPEAAVRLADAIERQEKILIIADYDCDGASACAVAVRGLRALGACVDYLVPNRFETGYGLTPEIVDIAHTRFAPDLVVTVDNGIASVAGAERARALGMALIITDHHLPGLRLPPAAAIVNPNQEGCGFASKNLAGVGVMFYVLLALRAEMRQRGRFEARRQPRLDGLLDLVALGTVADVVRLDHNNRLLVSEGLKRIREGRLQPGLSALFRVAGREARSATARDLGFSIGPRINAAGRLADMSIGIACLVTDDPDEATLLAARLSAINEERRGIGADMEAQALAALNALAPGDELTDKSAICVFDPSWHQGVVGILAGRLKERFHRPAIAFAPVDSGRWRGSGRSIDGVHLRDVLDLLVKREPALINQFGGHAMAAGLTISEAALPHFAAAFERAVNHFVEPAMLQRVIDTDGSLAHVPLSVGIVTDIERAVWGQGFAAPQFADRFAVISQRILKDKHTKLSLRLLPGQATFDAIWFNQVKSLGAEAEFVYRLVSDSYNGVSRIQVIIDHQIESAQAVR
jgi:single-stranded-DNA-specific exonuclease